MKATVKADSSQVSKVVEKLIACAQANVASGSIISLGWLFKGLTLYFHYPLETDMFLDSRPDEREVDVIAQMHRLRLASNLARFGGASIAGTDEKAVTHMVVDVDCSSSELSEIRGSLSTQLGSKKMPHLVTVEWLEESWKERTLLDEESRFERFYLVIIGLTYRFRILSIRVRSQLRLLKSIDLGPPLTQS
jgi:DNA ligase 4